jgi:hypothetical protein
MIETRDAPHFVKVIRDASISELGKIRPLLFIEF